MNGLRPLILGERETEHGTDYIVSSESVALDVLGYRVVGDIEPGMLYSTGYEASIEDLAARTHVFSSVVSCTSKRRQVSYPYALLVYSS